MKEWFIWFMVKFIGCTVIYGSIFFVVVLFSWGYGDKTTWQEYFIVFSALTVATTLYWEICELFERK